MSSGPIGGKKGDGSTGSRPVSRICPIRKCDLTVPSCSLDSNYSRGIISSRRGQGLLDGALWKGGPTFPASLFTRVPSLPPSHDFLETASDRSDRLLQRNRLVVDQAIETGFFCWSSDRLRNPF